MKTTAMSNQETQQNRSFWSFFAENLRLTYLLIITIIIGGSFAIVQMPKESSPEIDIPVAVVTTGLPGASATDVESLVTDPIESQIEGISNIEDLTSTSQKGLSQITVQFAINADSNESVAELRNQVSRATGELPDDASDPQVQKISFADRPILTLAVSGPYELQELGDYAQDIADTIEEVADVSGANVSGDPSDEYQVTLKQNTLAQYGLSITDLANTLSQANTDIPIGSIETDDSVYTVRFSGQLERISELKNVPVTTAGGTAVRLGDIAKVEKATEPLGVENRFSQDGSDSQPAVSVSVFKESGEGSIISMVNEIDEIIADMQGDEIPKDLTISKISNDAEMISADLSNLLFSGAITMVIIFTVLLLFLGWREAVLASISVPLTFLAGLIILYLLGYTINFLTLFSLILVLGILVDAAIVITEGFSEALQEAEGPLAAAYITLDEFRTPLIAGTMTTVFVFSPMLLTGGIIGKFIETIPVTVSVVLLCALFVALGILTALGSRFFTVNERSGGASRRVSAWISRMYNHYSRFLRNILANAKKRTKIFVGMTVLLIAALALPMIGVLQTTLFPSADMDTVTVNLEMPAGTSLSETAAQARRVEQQILQDGWVDSTLLSIGQSANTGSITVGSGSSNEAGITISLKEERELTSTEIVTRYNNNLPKVTDAEITASQQSSGPPTGKPIQVNLSGGETLDSLSRAAREVADVLKTIEGTENVETGLDSGASEFVAVVDRQAANRFGVSPQSVATILRAQVSGVEATNIKVDGEDIPVMLRYSGTQQASGFGSAAPIGTDQLLNTSIQTPQGPTLLSNLVSFRLNQSLPSISHDAGERQVTVSADTSGEVPAATVVASLQEKLEPGSLPTGVNVSYGGETQDTQESFSDLFLAMIIGIILIFALLTWQFNSYRQPLFMLATIPLALIGVLFGLAVVGQPLSFPAFIGVVALAGIVVNNAIILIDRININREDGASVDRAIYDGARSRLQPIILTTLTTVGGMLPLLFADPTWAPLAYAVIFGLIFSTVLTLVVVPLLYQRFAD